jgi:hypothetical protein
LEELFESFEELEEGELISLMDLTPSAGLPLAQFKFLWSIYIQAYILATL